MHAARIRRARVRGTSVLTFVSRQGKNADVGASNITMIRSSDGGESWSEQVQIDRDEHATDWPSRANPGAAVLPPPPSSAASTQGSTNHTVVLSYFVGLSHSVAKRVVRTSEDGGWSWSPERNLTDGAFEYMTGPHDRMRLLSNGRLVQVLHYKYACPEFKTNVSTGNCLGTLVYSSDDRALLI